jgi:predicted oxidoreductase
MSSLPIDSSPRVLGQSGIVVSPLAWGMWRFATGDIPAARAKVEAALDAGIILFDTADVYGPAGKDGFGAAEALLGRVLAEAPPLRDRMVLASKGGIVRGVPYDSSPTYLERALDASLKRLGTDRIDLYQIHRPDLLAHPAEVAEALARFVTSGRIRAVGVSNHTPSQAAALQKYLPFPLASHQPEFSPLTTAPLFNGVFDQALMNNMAVLAWSPFGGGRLGGGGTAPGSARVAELLDARATEAGVSRAAAAYAWIMAHPTRPIPIVGTQQPNRIREASSCFRVSWTRAQWYAVLEASLGEALP